ncbi:MAG: LpxD N-terminal domain-containing protein, partial [Pseudomonadota bacterium]|nr:LpxD N-terminal domain-containing protein [Pseudomonadota bacterium]
MADPRFFTRVGPFKISDIALQIGAHVPSGADADCLISDIEDIATASGGNLCFVTDKKYLPQLEETSAAAVLVGKAHVGACPPHVIALACDDPYTAMALAAQAFYP